MQLLVDAPRGGFPAVLPAAHEGLSPFKEAQNLNPRL
jgi:hypothetical protein